MIENPPTGALRIGVATSPKSLSKSLALTIVERESKQVQARGIGPGASKVFAEAWDLARGKLLIQGYDLEVRAGSERVQENGKTLTVLTWDCRAHPIAV